MENIDETNLPLSFVKPFGLTNGVFVRGKMGLIFMKKGFNCFNFYSIDNIFYRSCAKKLFATSFKELCIEIVCIVKLYQKIIRQKVLGKSYA